MMERAILNFYFEKGYRWAFWFYLLQRLFIFGLAKSIKINIFFTIVVEIVFY
jgi:hypothetical protein